MKRPPEEDGEDAPDDAPAPALDMEALEGLVGYNLRRAHIRLFDDFDRAFARLKFRPAQLGALILIGTNPGRSQREIAAALGVQRPNFVAMMDVLERRGLALRQVSETDRRTHALVLTEAGHQVLANAMRIVAAHEERVLADLTPQERESLRLLLRRI